MSALFEKMLAELVSDDLLKYDLLRTYAAELRHYTLKLQPADTTYPPAGAKPRLTAAFLALLEQQFPLEVSTQRVVLRSARELAQRLAVHPNHLNYCVRATTGNTTTDHIAARLSSEAKASGKPLSATGYNRLLIRPGKKVGSNLFPDKTKTTLPLDVRNAQTSRTTSHLLPAPAAGYALEDFAGELALGGV